MGSIKGVNNISSQAQKTRTWYHLEALVKISDKHPFPFFLYNSAHPGPTSDHVTEHQVGLVTVL